MRRTMTWKKKVSGSDLVDISLQPEYSKIRCGLSMNAHLSHSKTAWWLGCALTVIEPLLKIYGHASHFAGALI